jgi:hypothetical protein
MRIKSWKFDKKNAENQQKKFFKNLNTSVDVSILNDYLPQYSLIMTPTDDKAKLVKIYCYVCEVHEKVKASLSTF